ncbi:CPBP family intramembrane glutamic endopeptidase [Pseudonocardia alni]|uniref:CPBP family intramembrane glutamic endopeptidase n=1 Tax=Pseudonocardia alni TaxID=33907 RepID=UPI00280AF9A8|nr:CPBP family intramembrane glutamic endopeptidase [Pseudonocardia alni]
MPQRHGVDSAVAADIRRATTSREVVVSRSSSASPVVTGTGPRPGWVEVVVGLVVLAAVAYGGGPLVLRTLDPGPLAGGLFLAALSGIAGVAGFAAAVAVRRRPLPEFGVRATSVRWLLLGAAGAVLAFVVSRLLVVGMVALGIEPENIQGAYADAGSGGAWSVALSLLFLAVLTPLGEELLFRGVVTSALLRYGAVVGVLGSAVVFALAHGLNAVFLTALVVGLVAGELRRRSGSVWPGVVTHLVHNAMAQVVALAFAGVL